jgi:hypothetical protein
MTGTGVLQFPAPAEKSELLERRVSAMARVGSITKLIVFSSYSNYIL